MSIEYVILSLISPAYEKIICIRREHGTMLGKIVLGDSPPNSIKQLDPSKENVVAQVSTKVI